MIYQPNKWNKSTTVSNLLLANQKVTDEFQYILNLPGCTAFHAKNEREAFFLPKDYCVKRLFSK